MYADCAFRKAALLFESDEEQLEFMEERVLDQQMAQFLVFKKRFEEAAEIYLGENNTILAIGTLLDPECLNGAGRARELLIKELWSLFPMQCERDSPDGNQLMALVRKVESKEGVDKEVFLPILPLLNLISNPL